MSGMRKLYYGWGVESITLVDGILEQHQYMDILLNEMLPSALNLYQDS